MSTLYVVEIFVFDEYLLKQARIAHLVALRLVEFKPK